MANEITRTIKVYKHTFGELQKGDDGKFEIKDPIEVVSTTKMGNRLASAYIKEMGFSASLKLISVEEVIEKYAMPVNKFMELATKIN